MLNKICPHNQCSTRARSAIWIRRLTLAGKCQPGAGEFSSAPIFPAAGCMHGSLDSDASGSVCIFMNTHRYMYRGGSCLTRREAGITESACGKGRRSVRDGVSAVFSDRKMCTRRMWRKPLGPLPSGPLVGLAKLLESLFGRLYQWRKEERSEVFLGNVRLMRENGTFILGILFCEFRNAFWVLFAWLFVLSDSYYVLHSLL